VPTNSFMMDDVLAVAGTSLADSCMQQLAGLLLVSGGHGVTGKRRWRESETFGGCVPQTLARPDHRVLHVPADGEVRARVTLVAATQMLLAPGLPLPAAVGPSLTDFGDGGLRAIEST
jgi:hypothetical protein